MKNSSWLAKNKGPNKFIFSVLAFSLVLIFVIMIYSYNRTYQNARNDVIELSKSSSMSNAESMEMFFTRHEDVLLATAEIMEYSLTNENALSDEAETLLYNLSEAYNESIYRGIADKDFTGIYAAVDGVLIHAYKTPEDLPSDYDPTKRPWYSEGREGGGRVVFGEPYYDVYNPNVKVITATKLLSDGKTVVGMDITLEDMQYAGGNMDVSVTLNGKKHNYGHGFVLTGDGIVMAHGNSEEQGKCYNDKDSPMYGVFQKIRKCTDSRIDYMETDIDGVNYGIFPHKLGNGWYVVTLTELEDIRTTISDFSKLLMAGMAIVILLGIVYCIIIFRSYMRAEKLTENLKGALDLAKEDALTGFGNRTAYDMRIREIKERVKSGNDTSFVLVMLDLNDLKYVNDHFGHASGDKYILNSCNLVRSIFSCEIYRIGGDEFAVFLTDGLFEQWEELLNCLNQAVAEANMSLIPDPCNPSLAVGMAIHNVGADDIESVQRKADAEMYANKVAVKRARLENSEKGCTEDLKLKLLDKQMLVSEMQKGIDEEQFEVWFQPQVNHENHGVLIGAEALVRWRHPTRGMISPAVFIPMFEYNGLIYELDKYVWKHTCRCIRRWIDEGAMPLPISVNVSRLDIIQPDFIETITSIVDERQIPYDLIHLEVTESAFSDDTNKVVENVRKLINLGFIVAIDDFGSGYSSLSLLRKVPAHIVKLDMRFFADSEDSTRNECIVESIIRMVKMLGMAVLAEGVEYIEQADLLRTLGCAYIQGYLYSKPLPYADYREYVRTAVSETVNSSDEKAFGEVDVSSAQAQELFHNIITGTNDVIIVADRETRQLLYANRAAEKFFGKRFDPLHPTTCMKYCERGELCKNCPANNLNAGERREYVLSENGSHMKSLYIQMDWNGRDAFVLYQNDISAEMRKMEFANSLLNNLGVGIAIFRGNTPNELTPMFCNKEYMELSGLDNEEFQSLLTKDCMYGVHPDDISEARSKFSESFRDGRPMRHYIRVKKASGVYEWVSMYSKIKKFEAGDFEVYMIFWDAEEEMQKRERETRRYENNIARISRAVETSLSVIHLNLTKNICRSIHRNISVYNTPVFTEGLDGFIASVAGNVTNDEAREEFVRRFSTAALKTNFDSGIFKTEIHLPIRLSDQRIIWCYQTVNISRNPASGDLEAVMSLTEADKDIRLEEYYRRIITTDYELVGCIDAETGLVTIISEPVSHGLPTLRNGAVHYMENLHKRLKHLIEGAYVDACMEAISFDMILEKLKSTEDYICVFPAKRALMGEHAVLRWRFDYVNESKTEILFSRKELKGFLEMPKKAFDQ